MRFALALSLAAALGVHSAAAEPGFSDAERAALHDEIRAYLLENPEILTEMIELLEERQSAESRRDDAALVAEHSGAIFDDGFSYVGGNPEGSFSVVEFLDYQCGYCRRAHPDLQELLASDGDIRWIVKEMPVLGPGSVLAARAAIAALMTEGSEAYAKLNDALMQIETPISDAVLDRALEAAGLEPAAIRDAMEAPEVDRRLAETAALAQTLQIQGTPTFVFESEMVRGYVPLADMKAIVAELRETL